MHSSKVLVLGAGVYQIPLIQRAVDLGHYVYVASWSGKDPGMAMAHEAWVVDTTHKENLLEIARKKGIQAVTTTGTDVAVPSVGYICENLGLPGLSFATAQKCSNKILMQAAFSEHSVPAAAHGHVSTLAEAYRAAETVGYPVIVKAPDSSGSRGMAAANAPGELAPAFIQATHVSRFGRVLIERLLTGQEFGGQLVVVDGAIQTCIFHNDTVAPPPVPVPIGHSCPTRLSTQIQQEAERVCAAAVSALGIMTAVCNADLILTRNGVYVLEIGARMGATGIPEIIRLHTGLDLYDIALRLALGENPTVAMQPGPAAAILVIRSPATGILVRRRIPEDLARLPGVVSIKWDFSEGAPVRRFLKGPDRIGDIIATATTAEDAEQLCGRVAKRLEIVVEEPAAEKRPG